MKQIYNLITALLIVKTPLLAQDPETVANVGRTNHMSKVGNYLYVADDSSNKITRVDLSTTPPTRTDFVTGVSKPSKLAIRVDEL